MNGGREQRPAAAEVLELDTLDPITRRDEALRPACRRFTLGEDALFDLDLRSPSV